MCAKLLVIKNSIVFYNNTCSRLLNIPVANKDQNELPNGTFLRRIHETSGKFVCPGAVSGQDRVNDARTNKGLAFTLRERQTLGIQGLLPAVVKSQTQQVASCKTIFMKFKAPITKYLYLIALQGRNQRLFYRFITENIQDVMPIVYTPTVGLACQHYGLIYRRPNSIFISIHDRCHILDILKNWREDSVRAVCVTDGERILGLGDLGSSGMGIPIGKLALYTGLGRVPPHFCLPITLDCGCNNPKIIKDPTYLGLRQKRVQGAEYYDFVDEFMEAVVKRWGQDTLIQFEDFNTPNAFKFMDKYMDKYCTFNDDLQGTGSMVVGGLYASTRVTKKKLSEYVFLFVGAGGAGVGVANLIVKAMEMEGVSAKDAIKNIYLTDKDGLLTSSLKNIQKHQKPYVKDMEPIKDLEKIVEKIKPSVLIGAAGTAPPLFTKNVLKKMADINKIPVVFALSNPTSKAECTSKQAYEYTGGRVVYASGSPMPDVEMNGKKYRTGQSNNAYIFPGVALGAIVSHARHIPTEVFLVAAKTLGDFVDQKTLDRGMIYPPLNTIPLLSVEIAIKITQYMIDHNLCGVYPTPCDIREWIQDKLYDYHYEDALAPTWDYPKN